MEENKNWQDISQDISEVAKKVKKFDYLWPAPPADG